MAQRPDHGRASDAPEGEAPRWLDEPRNVDKVFYALAAVCAAVVLADLGYDKHGHFGFENVIGFHAMFGFVAYVGLITLSKGLRKLVMRREDYYPDGTAPDLAPTPAPNAKADSGQGDGQNDGQDAEGGDA